MIASSESNTGPYAADRRNFERQRVLFSSVVLSEGNCGRVLNISPHGLALQTHTELVGEEFPFCFKFSPSLPWVEAKGRVAWRSDSKTVVGIEFIGLTDDVQKQIQTWMDWRRELSEPCKSDVPVGGAQLNEGSGTSASIATPEGVLSVVPPPAADPINLDVENQKPEIPGREFLFPPLESAALNAENQNPPEITAPELVLPPLAPANLSAQNQSLPSTIATVQDQIKTRDLQTAAEMKIARGISKRVKLVGLALVIILLLSAVFFRRNHLQTSSNSPQTKEVVRAPRPSASPAQAILPAANPPATAPGANSSTVNAPVPHVSSSDRKPAARGPAFVLQVAAMLHEENANGLAATLRELNFPAFVIKLPTERFHHVLVGPFNSASDAIETQNKLEQRGYKPIRREWKVSSH